MPLCVFFKITKVFHFEYVKVFRKDPFLALLFSLSSLMIFWPHCLLPSAALFTLIIWPFGPSLPWSPLWWRPHQRGGVVIRAFALQSVDLGFIPLVESYQKTLKNDIHSFPAWRSAFMGGCTEQAGKFACCVLGQGT